MPAPTFIWRDPSSLTSVWDISIAFSDGSMPIQLRIAGERWKVGESDPRCIAATNQPAALTPEQAAAHTWTPDASTWATIQLHSKDRPATVTIQGRGAEPQEKTLSRGRVTIQISSDPVGAPIFYRDVPLMPSENEKGVIKPLAPQAVPLIAWRLRDVTKPDSRVLMQGLHTCANCHSFSADGRTLGMDMDGPQNDKGLYAIAKVQPHMTIRNEDLVAWSTHRGKLGSKLRVGFMSQLSPDAKYVVTTINDPGIDQTDYQRRKDPIDLVRNYYVANFKDYRFLQVFYPTRGVLAWYARESSHLSYLPGADDPRYVQTNAVWSPDGKYLVFARAEARDAYPSGGAVAQFANDPNETQIQFDLYRIAFNDGKGGIAEPIAGAANDGMSHSFPKISPDGRWIVFVRSRNGLLMRPDGELYIVPVGGGTARRMRCNTALMNSWHSFSPNGHWMVFASKSRSPYTQMYLTHIDALGNDSPAVLIENTTAANRAINLPEFVNIPEGGLESIDTPAADHALHTDLAIEAMKSRDFARAVLEWNKALELAPAEWRTHNSLGVALMEIGRVDEALTQYREALKLNPEYAEAYNNQGEAMVSQGRLREAITEFSAAVQRDPGYAVAQSNLGMTLARIGQTQQALIHLKKVVELKPDSAEGRRNFGHALADEGALADASEQLAKAVELTNGRDALALHLLGRVLAGMGRTAEGMAVDRQALAVAEQQNNPKLSQAIQAHLADLEKSSAAVP